MRQISFALFVLILIASLILAGCGPKAELGEDDAKPRELFVLQFGGAYEDVLRANAAEFEEAHNAKITFVPAAGMDALIKAKNKEVDVVFTDPIYAFRGEREQVWAKLDEESVPNLTRLHVKGRLSEYTVAHDFGCNVIGYNPKYVKEPPTSWQDFWKPEYRGKIGLPGGFRGGVIDLMFLMARLNGGGKENLDPGFKKMAELSPHIHTWTKDHPQILDLMRTEQIWLTLWSDGRINWAKGEGANIEMAVPEEGGFPLPTTMNAVAGRPNADLALAYIDFELSEGPQLAIAKELGYFPLNKEVQLPPEIQEKCAFTPENVNKVEIEYKRFIESNMNELNERWEREVYGAK